MSETSDEHLFAGAQWIWGGDEASPRNAWRCFRTVFDVDVDEPAADLLITADTRYTVWVNGRRIGEGPVRGFPSATRADRWPVGDALRIGSNVIAVLVRHDGIATFQTLHSRGGLIAEVALPESAMVVGTGDLWDTSVHHGYDARASRIGPQLAFTEIHDADWEPSWTTSLRCPDGWERAAVVADAGEHWTLAARDIPHLERWLVTPRRVVSTAAVRASTVSRSIDARAVFTEGSHAHAEPVSYAGLLWTILEMDRAGRVVIGLPVSTAKGRVSGVAVGGQWFDTSELEPGDADLRVLRLTLPAGQHGLLLDVSMYDHGYPVHLLVDAPQCGLRLVNPLGRQADGGEFAALGPVGVPDSALERPLAHPAHGPVRIGPADRAVALQVNASLESQAWRAAGLPCTAIPQSLVAPVSLYGDIVHPAERADVSEHDRFEPLLRGEAVCLDLDGDSDAEVTFDLGVEYSGFIRIDLDARHGTLVDVLGSEYERDGYREETITLENSLRFRTRDGRQKLQAEVRRGLRYLRVVFRGRGSITVHGIALEAVHYPIGRVGAFACSDAELTDIWEMSRRTVVACAEDTFVDCPAYEQAYWVGDAYTSARFASALDDVSPLVERSLRLVPGSRPQTELLGSQVPSGWTNVIPSWSFLWVLGCRDHVVRTGDTVFAAEMLVEVIRTLDGFAACDDDSGLLSIAAWNFLDWAQIDQPNDGVVTHQNCLFVAAYDAAAELADFAGDAETATGLRARGNTLRQAIASRLWDPTRAAYADAIRGDGSLSPISSVQTQLFAWLAGIGDESRLARLGQIVRDQPPEFVQIGSAWMSSFRYDALIRLDAVELILPDVRENYGGMLAAGAVSCWEVYPSPHRSRLTRSHCHAWSAAPASLLPRIVLGIEVLGPRRVRIDPQTTDDLVWARGSAPLIGGAVVSVSWTRDADGVLVVDVEADADVVIEYGPALAHGVVNRTADVSGVAR